LSKRRFVGLALILFTGAIAAMLAGAGRPATAEEIDRRALVFDDGNHSISLPLDIGLADASRRTDDLPLYTLQNRTTHEVVQTSDPGRAMVTGHRGRASAPAPREWSDTGDASGARPLPWHSTAAAGAQAAAPFTA
jgi:hypothetical protein